MNISEQPSTNKNTEPTKDNLSRLRLDKLRSPGGVYIAPLILISPEGKFQDAVYADAAAMASMSAWGMVAEYPTDLSKLLSQTRRDYEPVARIKGTTLDCDDDTALIQTPSLSSLTLPKRRSICQEFTEQELESLSFSLLAPGIPEGLIMSVVMDEDLTPLMVAFKNRAAMRKTVETGLGTYLTRSRGGKLWTKGEESGNSLFVQSFMQIKPTVIGEIVKPVGPVCHTGARTCFDTPPVVGS